MLTTYILKLFGKSTNTKEPVIIAPHLSCSDKQPSSPLKLYNIYDTESLNKNDFWGLDEITLATTSVDSLSNVSTIKSKLQKRYSNMFNQQDFNTWNVNIEHDDDYISDLTDERAFFSKRSTRTIDLPSTIDLPIPTNTIDLSIKPDFKSSRRISVELSMKPISKLLRRVSIEMSAFNLSSFYKKKPNEVYDGWNTQTYPNDECEAVDEENYVSNTNNYTDYNLPNVSIQCMTTTPRVNNLQIAHTNEPFDPTNDNDLDKFEQSIDVNVDQNPNHIMSFLYLDYRGLMIPYEYWKRQLRPSKKPTKVIKKRSRSLIMFRYLTRSNRFSRSSSTPTSPKFSGYNPLKANQSVHKMTKSDHIFARNRGGRNNERKTRSAESSRNVKHAFKLYDNEFSTQASFLRSQYINDKSNRSSRISSLSSSDQKQQKSPVTNSNMTNEVAFMSDHIFSHTHDDDKSETEFEKHNPVPKHIFKLRDNETSPRAYRALRSSPNFNRFHIGRRISHLVDGQKQRRGSNYYFGFLTQPAKATMS